jgi:hypothetical protein
MNQPKQEQNERLHNYFYKITNLINGKYYYGIHSTDNLDDGYMGSGTLLKDAIKKYGKENFSKEIITDYPTRKAASDHEKEVVTLELIELDECYNCRTGGENGNIQSSEIKQQISQTLTGLMTGEKHWTFLKPYPSEGKRKISEFNIGKTYTIEYKQNMSKTFSGLIVGENHAFYGKQHSEETRKTIIKTRKEWNKKAFFHTETNQIFQTRKEVRDYFQISQWSVRNWILLGRLELIDK